MLFIAFNAIVVFKTGWLRILGVTATILILGLAAWNHGRRAIPSDAAMRCRESDTSEFPPSES